MEQHSFQEVMKQWRRRCEACEKNEPVECNITGYVCEEFCKMQKHHIDPEFVEREVMSWAAEHPEPVYPTWMEWFRQTGVVPCTQKYFHDWLLTPIPADIAQKLGIEPKEGT